MTPRTTAPHCSGQARYPRLCAQSRCRCRLRSVATDQIGGKGGLACPRACPRVQDGPVTQRSALARSAEGGTGSRGPAPRVPFGVAQEARLLEVLISGTFGVAPLG